MIKKSVNIAGTKISYRILCLIVIAFFVLFYPANYLIHAQETSDANMESQETDSIDETKENEEDSRDLEKKLPENLKVQGYDVIYVIDNSRSTWKQQEARNQALRSITNLAVGSDIRIGMIYFADHIYENYTLSLTSMQNQEGSQKVFQCLDMKEQDSDNRDTNIGAALEKAAELFRDQDSSRNRIIVLFSDGKNENFAQDIQYTQEANKKTEEQAAILEGMGIPIYCVYLQKNYNDEEYLKDLVNYFSPEDRYSSERFSKLTEEEIDRLADKFADVFYIMQNNMKYRKISLDSFGSTTFYVPFLGIQKLQIYLNGDFEKASINPPQKAEMTQWDDKGAVFANYENPPSGDWSMEVDCQDIHQVYGTIAYYVNLLASAELVSIPNTEKDADPAKAYQLIVRFYDEDGKEVLVDPKVSVNASLCISEKKEAVSLDLFEEEKEPINLEMTIEDGIAKSNVFSVHSYGMCSYKVNLTYEDFVDLTYLLRDGSIEKTAPIVHDAEGKRFYGEKTEEEVFYFSIKEEDLYTDPEGEEVMIKKVIQLNPSNPVNVEQKDGYFTVTAEQTGDINFSLQLMDSSGMSAEVSVQGTLIDRGKIRMIVKSAIGIILLIICGIFALKYVKKAKKGLLEKLLTQFDHACASFNDTDTDCKEEQIHLFDKQAELKQIILGNDKVKGIQKLTEALSEDQKKDFPVSEYLSADFSKKVLSEINEAKQIIENARKNIKAYKVTAVKIKNGNEKEDAAIKKIKECCRLALQEEENLKKGSELLKIQNKKLDEIINEIKKTADEIKAMLQTDITCDLKLNDITGIPGMEHAMGRMSCTNDRNEFRKGFYSLDEVTILGKGKLGKNIESTKIYVYGYKEKEGVSGLKLKSTREFTCTSIGDAVSEPQKQAVLLRGQSYQLTCWAGRQEISMKLSVG